MLGQVCKLCCNCDVEDGAVSRRDFIDNLTRGDEMLLFADALAVTGILDQSMREC